MPPVGGGAWLSEDVCGDSIVVGAARGARAGRPLTVGRRPTWRAMLVTMRPKQWVKNALVVAAAGAAGALTRDDVPLRVALACLAFCLLASGIYAINDVRDAAEDRRHPYKRLRPVAAGELDPRVATLLGVVLLAGGLGLSAAVRPLLTLVAVGYVALTVSYTIALRRVPILDIAAIAGGFVLRAVAGGVAAPVTLSRWFVLVVTAAAVLVAAAKRQAELRRTATAGVNGRSVLERYGAARLRLIVIGSAALALFAYVVWAFALADIDGIPWRPLTIIPFAACLTRYGALVRTGGGEAPEELLLGDRWLALAGVVWLAVFGLSVHAAG
ncbi:MAG: decaprenyl-phosphate phosphoribosyltransferase [Solirubrobacterales bacterium]|nr:decaprenyl-phosphate phosphoribosyltransferase [Solirubrobacterales bacterium]